LLTCLSWYLTDRGYVKTYYKGRHWQMHQLIVGKHCDHHNRDKLDNTRENLVKATPTQNNANRPGWSKSGLKGTYLTKDGWESSITHKGKKIRLGYFKDSHTAALIYDLWAKDLWGDFACTNFNAVSTAGKS
jgi:hypothetical protein